MRPVRWPTAQPRNGGSRFEQWLATTRKPPLLGTFSSPSTVPGPTIHSSQLVMMAPGWKNQVRTSGPDRCGQVPDDLLHAGLDTKLAGIDHQRSGRLAQRRDRAAGVGRIPRLDLAQVALE